MGNPPEMQFRDKLAEAHHFLNILLASKDKMDEFNYNLSAFLGASHGVMDVMLYDFVEMFELGFSRDDRLAPRDFFVASKATSNKKALAFLEWWNAKTAELSKNPLWVKRHFIVHRGYPAMHVFYTINASVGTIDTTAIDSLLGGHLKPQRITVVDSYDTSMKGGSMNLAKSGIFLSGEKSEEDVGAMATRLFDTLQGIATETERRFSKP